MDGMEIEIRQATAEDIDELMDWRMEVLHSVFPEEDDEILWARVAAANNSYYTLSMLDGSHIAVFAEFLGEPVGCGGVCFQQEMPSPDNPNGKCAYLMNIYTRPSYRGHGVAKHVVEWLVAQAKAHECGKIYLESTAMGREVYEECGFVDLPDMMHIPKD